MTKNKALAIATQAGVDQASSLREVVARLDSIEAALNLLLPQRAVDRNRAAGSNK